MALRHFDHVRPASLEEASRLAEARGGSAAFVAGGTDLLGILKDRVHLRYPELLVDLKGIPGLDRIEAGEGGARIGALATLADLAASPIVRRSYPLLAEAARAAASPQLRNMGTIGGNICQEPRCWYYRNPENRFPCLRKGGGKCNAIEGENRFHSIFGAARLGMPSCRAGCPGNVEIPLYLSKLRALDMEGAARILLDGNPMPAVTGRVCPHFCERSCNKAEEGEAVSVRAVERALGDFILEHAALLMPPPERETGESVAIVGSGPAGLAAAFYLRRSGHAVTVFERLPKAGGMLAFAIPAYRLPKDIVERLVESYEAMGIAFELGSEVGAGELSLASLRRRFDRVFLSTGSWGGRTISIPGQELLASGLDFLIDIQEGRREAPGRKVLVIGGGNVAVDVAISALRLGAQDVTMACLEARDIMPAFPEDLAQALEEGVKLLPSWGPLAVIQDGEGVGGMELVRCSSVFDAEGRFRPSFDPDKTRRVEADRIFLAIGQQAELGYAADSVKIERGLIAASKDDQSTSFEGLYAGGDATTGPASVVEALAAGRRAAQAIDAALLPGKARTGAERPSEALHEIRAEALTLSKRVFIPALQAQFRSIEAEDTPTLARDEVEREARRCIDCGCVAVNASDLAPALVALDATMRTTRRSLSAEDFFAAKPLSATALEAGELVTEIELPPPAPGGRFAFRKFRARNSIDFPILSVAAAFVLEGGRVTEARMAFGAAAPLPMRARAVEEFLIGRALDEESAAGAASIAARGAFPLERNAYKVQVLSALVRKAILGLS
jgi:NADPH-dependent glutamate synthase beta subunit-like oxidoreductase/CO/xanthine dehydrogenase FAD-binding subunit